MAASTPPFDWLPIWVSNGLESANASGVHKNVSDQLSHEEGEETSLLPRRQPTHLLKPKQTLQPDQPIEQVNIQKVKPEQLNKVQRLNNLSVVQKPQYLQELKLRNQNVPLNQGVQTAVQNALSYPQLQQQNALQVGKNLTSNKNARAQNKNNLNNLNNPQNSANPLNANNPNTNQFLLQNLTNENTNNAAAFNEHEHEELKELEMETLEELEMLEKEKGNIAEKVPEKMLEHKAKEQGEHGMTELLKEGVFDSAKALKDILMPEPSSGISRMTNIMGGSS